MYADEVKLHVFEGPSGTEIFSQPHCSGTTYEEPVIVDVTGNGRANIVVCENNYALSAVNCDPSAVAGIRVFHDAADNWVKGVLAELDKARGNLRGMGGALPGVAANPQVCFTFHAVKKARRAVFAMD